MPLDRWGRHVDTMICKVQLKIDGSAKAKGGEGEEKKEVAGVQLAVLVNNKAHMWHRRQEDWGEKRQHKQVVIGRGGWGSGRSLGKHSDSALSRGKFSSSKQFSKAEATVKRRRRGGSNSSSRKNNKACTHVRLILIGFGIVRRSNVVAQIPMQTAQTHTQILETENANTNTVALCLLRKRMANRLTTARATTATSQGNTTNNCNSRWQAMSA